MQTLVATGRTRTGPPLKREVSLQNQLCSSVLSVCDDVRSAPILQGGRWISSNTEQPF